MRLDNEPLMRQGIIQGLRSQIRPDVKIQKPAAAPGTGTAVNTIDAPGTGTSATTPTTTTATTAPHQTSGVTSATMPATDGDGPDTIDVILPARLSSAPRDTLGIIETLSNTTTISRSI